MGCLRVRFNPELTISGSTGNGGSKTIRLTDSSRNDDFTVGETSDLVAFDLAAVVAYSLVMLLVGWRSRRQSGESYWVAARRYGTGRISASLLVTIFGATSTLGVIGLGYSRGLTGAWWSLTGAIALIPFGFFLAGRVRDLAVYTLPDILKRAYGNRVAVPAALLIAVSWCGIIAAQMAAGARLLSGVFPLGFLASLAIVAVVFVLYTFWGGQLSVVRTDSWQLVLFLAALLICVPLLMYAPPTGTAAALHDSLPTGHLSFPVSAAFGWYELLVYYPLIVGLPFLVGPDLYSRVFCARDARVARRSVFISAAAIVPIAFLLVFAGILIRAWLPEIAPDAALPEALNEILPAGLRGLIVAGFLAAIMSSADTTLVTASTILSLNVVSPFAPASESRRLTYTRVSLVAVGCVAWLIAGFRQGIIPALLLGYTIYVGGVVVPTVASFFRERLGITPTAAMCAVVAGGVTAILGEIRGGDLLRAIVGETGEGFLSMLLGSRYPSILPLVLSVLVLTLVSGLTCGDRSGCPGGGSGEGDAGCSD